MKEWMGTFTHHKDMEKMSQARSAVKKNKKKNGMAVWGAAVTEELDVTVTEHD